MRWYDLVLILCGLIAGRVAFGHLRRLPRASGGPAPPVTVVIPARNEEATLPLLLGDLAHAPRAGRRVIVVDDHSTDLTAALARSSHGVEVIAAPPVPEGWLPKSWACHEGALRAADDDVLIFLDADVRLERDAVDAVAAHVGLHGGLVSVVPRHRVVHPREQLSALFNVVAVMGSGAGHRRPTGAFGPVMATTAADYRRVGGHASVSNELVEDMALARRYRATDLPVSVVAGEESVGWRMYPGTTRDLIDGWTKNIATGAGATPPLLLVAIVAWIAALCTVALAWGRLGPLGDVAGGWEVGATIGLSAATVAQLRWCFGRVGDFAWWAPLALPLHLLGFLGVFARSTIITATRGTVRWRGRDLPVRSPKPAPLRRSS